MFALAATQTLSVPSLPVLAVIAVVLFGPLIWAVSWYTKNVGCAYSYLMERALDDYKALVEHHGITWCEARAKKREAKEEYRTQYTLAEYPHDPYPNITSRIDELPEFVSRALLEYLDAKTLCKRAKAAYAAATDEGVASSGLLLQAFVWPRSPELRAYLRDHDHKLLCDEHSIS